MACAIYCGRLENYMRCRTAQLLKQSGQDVLDCDESNLPVVKVVRAKV